MDKSVYLSPSVQEKNIGVNGYKSEEYRMNQICDVTEPILKRHGIKVYRNKPNMTLSQVVSDSNTKNADVHFAVHSNAFDKKSRGCEIFCHRKGGEGEKLSKSVYKYISALTPTADRGIKEGCNFYGTGKHMYEVWKTKMPASLIEIAFHDNLADANWIMKNIRTIGIAIAKGILDYFKIEYKPDQNAVSTFPVTEKTIEILGEISPYSKTWISFFKNNEHINLSGLIEILYDRMNEAEKNYNTLLKDRNNIITEFNKVKKECSQINETIENFLKYLNK